MDLKKIWKFIWEDNSIWSWLVNIVLAFVLIKFILYPGLGLILGTKYPLVAVVSGSMEHPLPFDDFWSEQHLYYEKYNITKTRFESFPFRNGFNKGDIMVLRGKKPENIKIGDVIVFKSGEEYPIIHRVIKKWKVNGTYHFQTKGDNNPYSILNQGVNEFNIPGEDIVGVAWLRIPWVGNIKIYALKAIGLD